MAPVWLVALALALSFFAMIVAVASAAVVFLVVVRPWVMDDVPPREPEA